MPRPKVHPSQRRRAAEACNFCRASKKRCSATVPCTACQRRGIGASCYLTHQPRGSRTAPPQSGSSGAGASESSPEARDGGDVDADEDEDVNDDGQMQAAAASESLLASSSHQQPGPPLAHPAPAPAPDSVWGRPSFAPAPPPEWASAVGLQAPVGHGYQPISPSDSRISGSEAIGTHTADDAVSAPHRPGSPTVGRESHARMLLNLRGERVYIGGGSALSFLQFVRDTVAAQIGPSQFSHNDKSDSMLETESAGPGSDGLDTAACDLNAEDSAQFAQIFQAATGGLLDLFTPPEIDDLLLRARGDEAQSMTTCQRASCDLVIAIGAQCKSLMDSQQIGQTYFRRAQKQAFASMLEDPQVDMVRAFLLMAFYMLGQCRRNTAFMYLGIAARAAVALGLHSRDSYVDMGNPTYQTRLRIWMSLCVLDMLVSSILGRPPATAGLRSELEGCLGDLCKGLTTPRDQSATCLLASYRVLVIIHEGVDMVYGKKVASTALIEQILNRIEEWSDSLPDFIRRPPSSSPIITPQRATTSSIYISCLYYFAVTLVTRPILISTLTSPSIAATPPASSLASACLDAAVYLVQTCADARRAGLLLGNMCIMKALVFAAGIILGFDMFAKRSLDYEVEMAFQGARDVLDYLSIQSPQAAHYSEILTLLFNAITKQRRKQTSRSRSKYVGRIFAVNDEGEDARDSNAADRNSQLTNQDVSAGIGSADVGGSWFMSEQSVAQPTDMDGDLFRGWDSLDLSQWDNFPFLSPRVFGPE